MTKIISSPNSELRVLSSLLMLGDYTKIEAQKAMLKLYEDCFLGEYHRGLFMMIKSQYDQRLPFGHVALLDLLRKKPKEYDFYFQETFKEHMFATSNLEHYVNELILADQLRKKILISKIALNNTQNAPNNHEANECLNEALKSMAAINLNKNNEGRTLVEIGELYFDGHYDKEIIKTNIDYLDKQLGGGIKNSCLVTICGDTGAGKTYFALYLTYKIGNNNPDKQSLYFNLEMAEQHNWERLIGIASKKPFGQLTNNEKLSAHRQLIQHPITIFEEKHSNIDDIITICRVKALEKPLSVVVIDYISLVDCKNDYSRSDLEQVSIAKRLASLAIELNCIVIATSQTNRNPGNRSKDDRCPYMTDASDSSGNYKSAEIWIGIDRPELYSDNPFYKNKFIARLRKNRNGRLFNAVWDFNMGSFGEVDCDLFFRQESHPAIEPIKRNPFASKTDRDYLDKTDFN